jgi:hypothetical protein
MAFPLCIIGLNLSTISDIKGLVCKPKDGNLEQVNKDAVQLLDTTKLLTLNAFPYEYQLAKVNTTNVVDYLKR